MDLVALPSLRYVTWVVVLIIIGIAVSPGTNNMLRADRNAIKGQLYALFSASWLTLISLAIVLCG